MRRFFLSLLLACVIASPTFAQAVIVPSPVPALTNNCVLKWQTGTSTWVCASASAASQPLTDSLGLIADAADAVEQELRYTAQNDMQQSGPLDASTLTMAQRAQLKACVAALKAGGTCASK